jgi:hypothetical protein
MNKLLENDIEPPLGVSKGFANGEGLAELTNDDNDSLMKLGSLEKIVATIINLKASNRALKAKNNELSEMVVELKLIIAGLFNKINRFR